MTCTKLLSVGINFAFMIDYIMTSSCYAPMHTTVNSLMLPIFVMMF